MATYTGNQTIGFDVDGRTTGWISVTERKYSGGAQSNASDADDAAILAAAAAAASSAGVGLSIGCQVRLESAAGTISVPVRFEGGGSLDLQTGGSVTLSGELVAGLHQIFYDNGGGVPTFSAKVAEVVPQWWGVKGDGSTDDLTPFQAMLDAVPESTHISVPPVATYYRLSGGLVIGKNGIVLSGAGGAGTLAGTRLRWDSGFAGTGITIRHPTAGAGSQIRYASLRDLFLEFQNDANVGVEIARSQFVNVLRCHIKSNGAVSNTGTGIYLEPTGTAPDWTGLVSLEDNFVRNFKYGVRFGAEAGSTSIRGGWYHAGTTPASGGVGISEIGGGSFMGAGAAIEDFDTGIVPRGNASIIGVRFESCNVADIAFPDSVIRNVIVFGNSHATGIPMITWGAAPNTQKASNFVYEIETFASDLDVATISSVPTRWDIHSKGAKGHLRLFNMNESTSPLGIFELIRPSQTNVFGETTAALEATVSSAGILKMGTTAATALGIYTNNLSRLSITSGGAVSSGRWAVPVSADFGDANGTLDVGSDAQIARWATTLTNNRTVTLSTTGAVNGDWFRVVRTGLGAFTLDVGGLKTIPSGTAAWVDVHYNGSAWVLTGYGTL